MTTRLEAFSQTVHTALNDATVERVFSRRRDGRHGPRRRIHWYSNGGGLEAVSQAGGRETTSGTKREPAVWERIEEVECLVFAEDETNLELLLQNLIVSIDHTAPNGSAIFEGYSWEYDEVAKRVPLSRLVFKLKLPVVDETSPLTVITAEELTCVFEE